MKVKVAFMVPQKANDVSREISINELKSWSAHKKEHFTNFLDEYSDLETVDDLEVSSTKRILIILN
jgi:hypothetical protein